MPSDASVRTSAAVLVTSRPPGQPLVAVFFAGATGIGHYALRELARTTANTPNASGLRAYIVARREQVAREVIAECTAIIKAGTSGVTTIRNDDETELSKTKQGIVAAAEFVFIQTSDLSLMAEVDRICVRIGELERTRVERDDGDIARIDYLLFTHGCIPYKPRKDTKEGLDFTMAILYYSRMRALTQLLPLLLAASSTSPASVPPSQTQSQPQHHATVVSVYAAGIEDTSALHPSNLSLDNPVSEYSYNTARSHMTYMHTLFFEYLASHLDDLPNLLSSFSLSASPTQGLNHSQLTLAHVFPGLVDGPAFGSPELPGWFRWLWAWLVKPVFGWAIFTKPEVCGARLLSVADRSVYPPASPTPPTATADAARGVVKSTTGQHGGGTYALGSSVDDLFKADKYAGMDREKMREVVWKHTISVLDAIAGGGVFNAST